MSDIIKEFNMIDLLGMLLPGSLLAILFGNEFDALIMISNFLGTNLEIGLVITIILILGYIIGMLVHEVGDIFENLTLRSVLLNPKTYAALATGYANDNFIGNIPDPTRKNNNNHINLKTRLLYIFNIWNQYVLLAVISFACLGVCLFDKLRLLQLFHAALATALLLLFILFIYLFATKNFLSVGNTLHSLYVLKYIQKDNSIYSYGKNIDGSEEYTRTALRKRALFDGFKAMSRNFLITILLLNIYTKITKKPDSSIVYLKNTLLNNHELTAICIFIIILLIVRYFRYAFLKYKYCYEDIISMRH